MFDPNRAKLQKQYDELSEILKVYDAVKTVKENPTLFEKAIKLQADLGQSEDAEA